MSELQNNTSILIIDTQSMIKNQIEPLLHREGLFKNAFVNSIQQANLLLLKETFSLTIYKMNTVDITVGTMIELALKNRNIPLIYILDESYKTKFEYLKLTESYATFIEPFNKLTFRSTIKVFFKKQIEKLEKDSLLVKINGKQKRISFSEISWIKSEGNYCCIYSERQEFMFRSTMKKLLNKLPGELFIQVHKSYLIAIDKIESINLGDKLIIIEGGQIAVGQKYKKVLLDRLNII